MAQELFENNHFPEQNKQQDVLTNFATNFRRFKRTAVSVSTAAFLVLAPQVVHAQENQPDDQTKNELILGAKEKGFRMRIAEPWKVNGIWYAAFQEGLVEKSPDQPVMLTPVLGLLSNLGQDPKLASGELGVTIPPVTDKRNIKGILPNDLEFVHTPPAEILDFIKEKNLDLGLQTAPAKDFKDPQGEVVYTVYRFQDVGLQLWKDGTINFILAGEAAAKVGIVPKEVELTFPTDDPDIKTEPVQPPLSDSFVGGGPSAVGAYILAHSGWDAWHVACGESHLGQHMVNSQGSGARGYFQWMPGTAASVQVIIGNLPSEVDGFNRMVAAKRRREFAGYASDCPS